jgi:hypothetical protein
MMKPSKHLRYSEQNFAGYWVQLNSVIRHNDQADLILDGLLINPITQLCELDSESDLYVALAAAYNSLG